MSIVILGAYIPNYNIPNENPEPKTKETKDCFQFEIIINGLVSSLNTYVMSHYK